MKKLTILFFLSLLAFHLLAQTTRSVNGVFLAPPGSIIILQNNAVDNLSVVVKKDTSFRTDFKFLKPLAVKAKYNVTVKTAPAGMVCRITNGNGVMPQNGNPVKVECDFKYDLVSRSTNNANFSTFYESSAPAVAGGVNEEGRYVAFVSNSENFCGTTGKHRQIFWRDRNTGESFEPSLGTGEIAFTSSASNLVTGVDAGSMVNVYWLNLSTGEQKLISVDYKTKKGGGGSRPSISMVAGDSTKIAFHSASPNLVPGDKNNLWDIFVYSKNKPLKRISLTYKGEEREQGEESATRDVKPSISGNGRYVAFSTTASNLVPNDNNNSQDVFVVDTEKDTVVRVSIDSKGIEGNGDSPIGQGEKVAISYDGKWTAYNSKAKNLGAPDYNFFTHNSTTGETRAVTTGNDGCLTTQPVMSINASYVVFGMCPKLDSRFQSSGIFAAYTGIDGTRFGDLRVSVKK